MSTLQQAQAGDNARIIQIIGDNNYVGDSPHLFITPLPPAQPAPTEPAKDEASLLRPVIEATAFVGREPLLADFGAWANAHEAQRPVSVRVVHGGAGVGKTRFARELCRALGPDWQAGFVTNAEARRTLGRGNLGAWQWRKPTLIVFDYALSLVDALRVWLEELCAATPRAHPLRILLLERQADAQSGWLERLLQSGFGLNEMMPRDLLDGEPLRLPDLSSPAVRIGIMQNMLARLGSAVVLPAEDTDFQTRLAATDWAGAPLYLMMAAMVMHQQGGVGEVLHLGRVDLALKVAEHEHKRLLLPCGDNASMQILIAHMAAFATLRGGIGARDLGSCLAREREALGCSGSDVATTRRLLSELLPDGGEGVAPIQPDIVGEAFLLKHLADGQQIDGTDAVLRAFDDRPSEVAAVLVRCVQDFVPRQEKGAMGHAEKAQQRAMKWLRELGEMPELPLTLLFTLIDALPDKTGILLTLALDWQLYAVTRLRVEPATAETYSILASSLNNLAIRYRYAGRIDEGINAARQSVSIRRDKVCIDSDTFLPELALSLTTLANCLSHAGKQEEALISALEAVDIRRRLFDAKPKFYEKDLAHSLHALAIIFGLLKRPKEALPIAWEATDLFIELATIDPKNYLSKLAASFTCLSNRLSGAGNIDEAIYINCEAVAQYRELVVEQPDANKPGLAMSLNNLAHKLRKKEKPGKALPFSREAVSLFRGLATIYPSAFQADLAMSLSTLSRILSALVSHKQEALAISRETAHLYRALTQEHSDTFRDDFHEAMTTWLALSKNISRQEADALLKQDLLSHSLSLFKDMDESHAPTT
ncbi:tetratricopeptide repeat protein [Solidesulfovibrio carbinolicus]|uniref:Uncharacterized protein n=1 Tax=Solidesulfovibrio carbinolicus TaxID=296842 RepID=A0A4P6HIX9_9BACT|nr:tetratricopeptide repeat protein [Solidesulfovibrio carbinolicus]QAZ66795.1 hypothetical protein C3Y92_05865 [Solidesulfovibrio carbinolicus]